MKIQTQCSAQPFVADEDKHPIKPFKEGGVRPGVFYYGDNLQGLMNTPDESIDLIYLDPPFNSKKQWSGVIEVNSRKVEQTFKDTWNMDDVSQEWVDYITTTDEYQALKEVIEAVRVTAGESAYAYCVYMAMRLIQMHRVLKDTGSIYYHCDPVMSHSVKLLMDAIFGIQNFRNEISWCYSGGGVPKNAFARKHDVILFYAKSPATKFNIQFRPYADTCSGTHSDGSKVDVARGAHMSDWWVNISALNTQAKEHFGYPTQKPEALLERIIKASTNVGDVVLDPFAGSGTTCAVAEKLNRRRIGMDLNKKAARLAAERLRKIVKDKKRKPKLLSDGSTDQICLYTGERLVTENLGKLKAVTTPLISKKLSDAHRKQLKEEALQLQLGRCLGCGDFHVNADKMECDHIHPKAEQGVVSKLNTQALCRKCNGKKGKGTMVDLWNKRKAVIEKLPFAFWELANRVVNECGKDYSREAKVFAKKMAEEEAVNRKR